MWWLQVLGLLLGQGKMKEPGEAGFQMMNIPQLQKPNSSALSWAPFWVWWNKPSLHLAQWGYGFFFTHAQLRCRMYFYPYHATKDIIYVFIHLWFTMYLWCVCVCVRVHASAHVCVHGSHFPCVMIQDQIMPQQQWIWSYACFASHEFILLYSPDDCGLSRCAQCVIDQWFKGLPVELSWTDLLGLLWWEDCPAPGNDHTWLRGYIYLVQSQLLRVKSKEVNSWTQLFYSGTTQRLLPFTNALFISSVCAWHGSDSFTIAGQQLVLWAGYFGRSWWAQVLNSHLSPKWPISKFHDYVIYYVVIPTSRWSCLITLRAQL